MRLGIGGLALILAGALTAACTGSITPAAKPTESAVQAKPEQKPAAVALPGDAAGVVAMLKQRGFPIGETITFTGDNDPNKALGRPNQYTSKASFLDSRLTREQPEKIESTDGGTVETFANETDAKARQAYVAAIAGSATPFAEYGYREGVVLLRLAKRLTPEQAAQYETFLKNPGAAVVPVPAVAQQAPATTAPAPTSAPPPPTAGPVLAAQRVKIAGAGADGVNMRAEPSATAARVKGLKDGDELELIGPDRQADGRTWRNVKDPRDGATGWVAGDFVSAASADSPPAAPALAAPEPAAKPAAPAAPTAVSKVIAPTAAAKPASGRAAPQGRNCPQGFPVKGNQGSRSTTDWIYHVPGGASYAATDPEECFATAADASAAGYRASQR